MSGQSPPKYLGKLYIDRYRNQELDQDVIHRAVKIVMNQAPRKGKTKVRFITFRAGTSPNGYPVPATLLSIDATNGHAVSKTPVGNVLSVGRFGHVAYFLTVGMASKDIQRYWVRAFDCKTGAQARATVRLIVELAANVQPGFSPMAGPVGSSLLTAQLSTGSSDSGDTSDSSDDAGMDAAPPPRKSSKVRSLFRRKSKESRGSSTPAKLVDSTPAGTFGAAEAGLARNVECLTLGDLDNYVRVADV